MKTSKLPIDICRALVDWHRRHKRYWRTNLRSAWLRSNYGLMADGHKAALQKFRNSYADRLEAVDIVEVQRRVQHDDLRQATQQLIDKLCPGGFPAPSFHARDEAVKVIGLLQEAEVGHD